MVFLGAPSSALPSLEITPSFQVRPVGPREDGGLAGRVLPGFAVAILEKRTGA